MQLKKFEENFLTNIKKLHVFKKNKNILFIIILISISMLTLLLFFEYRFFSRQAYKLLALKEQYRMYVGVLREAVHKYGMLPEQFDEDLQSCNESLFPSGARVFSSDDPNEEWIFINREDEYLKQSSLSYLKKQQLDTAIKRLRGEKWFDYPDAFIQPVQPQQKKRTQHRSVTSIPRRQKQRIKDMYFTWPINRSRFWLSSFFGPRKKPNGTWSFHRGIDMAALSGTPVKASAPGKVIEARHASSGYGNTVVVIHNHKYKTRYAHLRSIAVKVGQKISRGTLIGLVGDTGLVRKSGKDASHLHFEVYAYGKQINPLYCLR